MKLRAYTPHMYNVEFKLELANKSLDRAARVGKAESATDDSCSLTERVARAS